MRIIWWEGKKLTKPPSVFESFRKPFDLSKKIRKMLIPSLTPFRRVYSIIPFKIEISSSSSNVCFFFDFDVSSPTPPLAFLLVAALWWWVFYHGLRRNGFWFQVEAGNWVRSWIRMRVWDVRWGVLGVFGCFWPEDFLGRGVEILSSDFDLSSSASSPSPDDDDGESLCFGSRWQFCYQ